MQALEVRRLYYYNNTAVIRVALDVTCIITTDDSVRFLELIMSPIQ